MSKEIKLSAQNREATEKVAAIRKSGSIPACLYGPGSKNQVLKVKKTEFGKAFALAGESHLIDLAIGTAAPIKVIVKDVQRDAIKEQIYHADFYQVDMSKKITTELPLHFIGESKVVKEQGGIVVKSKESIKVKCLAKDLVDNIEIDLSALVNMHDSIRMHDLKLPAGIELVSHTDEIIVAVTEQKAEIEKPVEAAAPAAEADKAAAPGAKEEAKTEAKPEAKK